MTTLEGAITALLIADIVAGGSAPAGVAAIVAKRIHPANDPQNIPRPKLTLQQLRSTSDTGNGGFANDGPTGFAVATIQVDCWSDSILTAQQAIKAVRYCLNGYAGMVGGIRIDCIRKTDERETPGVRYDGQRKPVERCTVEFNVAFNES